MRRTSVGSKHVINKYLFDKVRLLGAALAVFTLLFAAVVLLGGYLSLPASWLFFALGSGVYTTTTSYLVVKARSFSKLTALWYKIVAIASLGFPVGLFLCLFYTGILPMPNSLAPYTVGSVVLAVVATLCLDRFVKGFRR